MKAFITGSRVYGTPTRYSDTDLVVRLNEWDAQQLIKGIGADEAYGEGTAHVRLGDVDLLLCTTDAAYEVWRRGTEQLCAERPVTRERAVAVFEQLRQEAGIYT